MKYLLLLLLALAVLAFLLQDRMIFMPQPISAYSRKNITPRYQQHEFRVQVNGVDLHGWLLPSDHQRLVLYYGGNAEEVSFNLDDFSQRFEASVLCLNFRGYGMSDGKPSEKTLFADAVAVYDHITKEFPNKRIILIGRSLGSGVASYLASKRDVDRLVLVTPFDSMQSVASTYYPFLPVSLLLRHKFRSDQFVADLQTPTLVIGANNDEIIPRKNTERLIQSFATPPQVAWIAGTGHNNIQSAPAYWAALTAFING